LIGAGLALVDDVAELHDEELAARELPSRHAGRWLLSAAEQYAAAQAAPQTARTYRSTIHWFALFVQRELGLAPSVDALVLSTVLDTKRHLQAIGPQTDRPRARTARRSPSSSPRCAASRAGWRWMTRSASTLAHASSWSRAVAATRVSPAR
jgi:hypothetical protein